MTANDDRTSNDDREAKVIFEGVSKAFEKKGTPLSVLQDVDLSVREGEFLCLLGPSGCGKSTLLNIAGGFERPTTGSVRIDGKEIHRPSPHRVFVFQEYGIFPWASVWDNVVLGIRNRSRQEQHRIAKDVIELVGLSGFERAYPMELSGGMKQRVEVARALAVEPDVIFMDEPFGALDSLTRLTLRAELLRIWGERQPTILFVTHDVDEAMQLAQRVAVFTERPGRIAEVVTLDMPHPRDIGSPEYGQIKRRLFELLGVTTAI
jgi:NitT/TauT family transport system ATP-binding protein